MFYLGIDIGKFKHCFACINFDAEVLVDPTFFFNNRQGFDKLFAVVQTFSSNELLIGMESSGHYGDNLANFLVSKGYSVALINPLVTNAKAKENIRKTKTDKMDSLLICRTLISGKFSCFSQAKFDLFAAKQLTRYYFQLSESLNPYKNRLQKCLDHVFPEFNSLFKSKYSKPYFALLLRFGSAFNIANARIDSLAKTIACKGRGRSVLLDPYKLRNLARSSVGVHCDSLIMEIQHLIQNINLIESQITQTRKKIEVMASLSNSPIFSIAGIGPITGMSIISEFGDISQFSSADKMVAFAGFDPAVYQSGGFNAEHTRISKRGSRFLRKAFYLVALPVTRFNPIFHDYYTLKRSQGKSHRCAQGHLIRKLCRVIFKLVKEDILFDSSALV